MPRGWLKTTGQTPTGVAPSVDFMEKLTPSEERNIPINKTPVFLASCFSLLYLNIVIHAYDISLVY